MARPPNFCTPALAKSMIVPELTYNQIVDVVARALAEDVGQGDVTTMSVISANPQTRGRVVFREDAIVAGLSVAHEVFRQLDASAEIDARSPDGSRVGVGETVGIVVASTRAMLGGERGALNFLQRLSGIASLTRDPRPYSGYAQNDTTAAGVGETRRADGWWIQPPRRSL